MGVDAGASVSDPQEGVPAGDGGGTATRGQSEGGRDMGGVPAGSSWLLRESFFPLFLSSVCYVYFNFYVIVFNNSLYNETPNCYFDIGVYIHV